MICFSSSFVHNVLSVTILTRFHLHHSRHFHLINFPLQIRLFLYLLFFMMFFCGFFLPPFQPVIKCLKLTIQTLEQGVFIVNFELISHCVLVFVLLTLNRQIPSGLFYLPFENVCFLPSIWFFFVSGFECMQVKSIAWLYHQFWPGVLFAFWFSLLKMIIPL